MNNIQIKSSQSVGDMNNVGINSLTFRSVFFVLNGLRSENFLFPKKLMKSFLSQSPEIHIICSKIYKNPPCPPLGAVENLELIKEVLNGVFTLVLCALLYVVMFGGCL